MENKNTRNDQIRRLVTIGIVLAVALCLVLILVGTFGYAKLQINLPASSLFYLNGKTYSTTKTIKLHPGTYTIAIRDSRATMIPQQISLKHFQTKTITTNSFPTRLPINILTSVIGTYGGFGTPTFSSYKWFDDNTWLVGDVGPSANAPISLHYTNYAWSVGYFNDGVHVSTAGMPADALAYLQHLEATID
jgi:hypothetical protein